MKVCDRCGKPAVTFVVFKNKKHDLCSGCAGRIEKFLNSKEGNGGLFERISDAVEKF